MQNQEKRGTCPPSIDSYREKKDKAWSDNVCTKRQGHAKPCEGEETRSKKRRYAEQLQRPSYCTSWFRFEQKYANIPGMWFEVSAAEASHAKAFHKERTDCHLMSAEKPSDQTQKKGERFLENGKCYGENEAHSLKKATNWKHCSIALCVQVYTSRWETRKGCVKWAEMERHYVQVRESGYECWLRKSQGNICLEKLWRVSWSSNHIGSPSAWASACLSFNRPSCW
jgi:hypothetical protein